MPWIKELYDPKPHECRMPFWGNLHRVGSVWQCPKCQKLWRLSQVAGHVKYWYEMERVTVNGQDQLLKVD